MRPATRWPHTGRIAPRTLNFKLTTTIGDIDLFGDIAGGGGYEELAKHSHAVHLFDHDCRCIDFEFLIRLKQAAGWPKDLEAIAQLEALDEESRRQ